LASHGKLEKPTAIEVLFELRFTSSRNLESYAGILRRRFIDEYPIEEIRTNIDIGFKIDQGPDGPRVTIIEPGDEDPGNADLVSRRLKSSDGSTLFQIGEGVVTINTLDYQGFDNFIDEATRVLSIHQDFAQVESYRRLGLRYINHVSYTDASPSEISTWAAPVPPAVSIEKQVLSNAQEVVVRIGDHGLQKFTFAYPQSDQNSEPFTLIDIEHFVEFPEPVEPDIEALRTWIDVAHEHIWETYTSALNPAFFERRKYDTGKVGTH